MVSGLVLTALFILGLLYFDELKTYDKANNIMEKRQKVWIIIPAYNEEKSIGAVIDGLKAAAWNTIIVVDDGSNDNTSAIALEREAMVIRLLLNRGQGAAIKAGLEYANRSANPPDIVVTFDADGQHHPEDIIQLIAPILRREADIVLGSRFLKPDNKIPPLRKWMLKVAVLFTMIMADMYLTDTHNGLRAMNGKARRLIRITRPGMEHASEIIDEIKRRKLRFQEAPVTVTYTSYSRLKGQNPSHILKMGMKYIFSRLAS